MALVKVVGFSGKPQLIPRSMYESYFKDKGYMLFNDVEKRSYVEGSEGVEGESNHDENDNDVESIPIAEMNSKQLRKYADIKGIDLSEAKSAKEAKDIVREWLMENE